MMAWVCPICTFFISISKALDQVNDCGSKQSRENAIERESKAGVCSDKLVTVHGCGGADGMRCSS